MKIIYVYKNSEINSLKKAFAQLNGEDTTIYVEEGIYYEKLKLSHDNVTIIGLGKVNITYNDYALKIHKDGKAFNTFRTYTLLIHANNVHLHNLTIENSSGYGPQIEQAVALSLLGDNITLNNCKLKSYQDTLFLGPLPKNLIERYKGFLPDDERQIPQNYRYIITNSYIEGTIDYIFGCGKAFFEYCEFKNILDGGYVFAPSTYQEDFYGFTVVSSIFTSNSNNPSTFIARPWRDYGKIVLINCTMGKHIIDLGFNKWDDTNRDKTCRFFEYNSQYLDNHKFERIYFSKKLHEKELSTYLLRNFWKEK